MDSARSVQQRRTMKCQGGLPAEYCSGVDHTDRRCRDQVPLPGRTAQPGVGGKIAPAPDAQQLSAVDAVLQQVGCMGAVVQSVGTQQSPCVAERWGTVHVSWVTPFALLWGRLL